MSELQDLVLDAHRVTRWKSARTIEGYMSITGMLWARKCWPDALKQVRVTADTGAQRVSYQPFTKPDWRSVYHPEAVAIETSNGKTIKNRANPRAAFEGHTVETAWDDLHLAYFSGYAIWNYLNTPFLFQLPGYSNGRDRAVGRTKRKAPSAEGDVSGRSRDALSRTGVSRRR